MASAYTADLDESLDSSPDSSSEQDKQVLEPDEDLEDDKIPGLIIFPTKRPSAQSTTSKEQAGNNSDDDVLPTRRKRKGAHQQKLQISRLSLKQNKKNQRRTN